MVKKKVNSIFIGTRIEAFEILDKFTNIVGIITPKSSYVYKYNKKVTFFCNKKNEKKINIFLKNSNSKLILSSGYPFKIPRNVLTGNKIFINSHPGVLPKYKGKKSILNAYNNNEKYIGCTSHYINENIDDGKMIYQKSVNIQNLELSEIYQLVFSKPEPKVIEKSLEKIFSIYN